MEYKELFTKDSWSLLIGYGSNWAFVNLKNVAWIGCDSRDWRGVSDDPTFSL